MYLIIGVAVIIILFIFNKNNKEVEITKNTNPFGKNFKVLIDNLALNLWEGQKHILMKKNETQFFIQKSKLPHNESHIFITYKLGTITLDYYEKVAGVELTYKKMYGLSNESEVRQREIANDFSNGVNLYGKMKF